MAGELEEKVTLLDLACAKMSDAQDLIGKTRDLLTQGSDNVKAEQPAFEEETNLPKGMIQAHFDRTVKLNVGGKIYKTTLETLRKDSDSMLSIMFSGRHELKPDAEDGAYFIDRDGKLFRYILNYLRHGELLCPDDKTIQKELLTEAKFYQVRGVIAELEEKTHPFKSSVIIKNENHRLAVLSWLPSGARCSLLYQYVTGRRERSKSFHKCCDNKAPTIVVIKSGEYIFGGYTTKSWESTDRLTAIADSQSFLFSLVNPSRTEPIKITPIPGSSGGIRCRETLGPSFGTKDWYDLEAPQDDMFDDFSRGRHCLGNGFVRPRNADSEVFFTHGSSFEITELEVFKVDY